MENQLLHQRLCPKSSQFDTEWMLANEMGPNAVWLAEILADRMNLSAGMRVLDLGCGRAMTSIFLTKTYGVKVWGVDLWIGADDNWSRVTQAGLENGVFPIQAEAHSLPFAAGFFESMVSIDSYQYYGTDDLYLSYITRFLKDGGQLGLVMPALMQEIDEPPPHLTRRNPSGSAFWDPRECWCFHTVDWWHRHFSRPGVVDIEVGEVIPEGWRLWLEWEQIRNGGGFSGFPSDAAVIAEDRGEYLGFVLFVLKKRASEADARHPLTMRIT